MSYQDHAAWGRLNERQRAGFLEMAQRGRSSAEVAYKLQCREEDIKLLRRLRKADARRESDRLKREEAAAEVVEHDPASRPDTVSLVDEGAMLTALRLNHPYAHGEPTRETVQGWASSHSGKRELSTLQVAALRAPTVVCTVSMLEGLA
jgi:hypothetical protein